MENPATTEGGALPPLTSLKCSLCDNYFREPLTLQCLHSFCTSCLLTKNGANEGDLESFLAPKNAPVPPPSTNAKHNKDGQIPVPEEPQVPPPRRMVCPYCTDVLGIEPPNDPTEPFKNERLARIVRLVHETPVLCQNCRESESEVKCNTCEAYCCRPCWEKTHSAPIFAVHQGHALRHSEMTALPKCPQHVLNDQEFFVTEHEVGACQVCLLKGDYVGQSYALVTEVCKERQEDIEQSLEDVAAQRTRVVDGKQETLEVLQALDTNLTASSTAVKQNFAAIREALDRREKETLEQLEALKEAKKRVLTRQVEAADRVVSQLDDGTMNVKLILNHSHPLEVVYQTYVIGDHLNRIGTVENTAPRVCTECAREQAPCHHPAVDASLPVVLSDRVPLIVSAYAAVPDAKYVEDVASGIKSEGDIAPQPTAEQKSVMKQISAAGAAEAGEEWGCTVM